MYMYSVPKTKSCLSAAAAAADVRWLCAVGHAHHDEPLFEMDM